VRLQERLRPVLPPRLSLERLPKGLNFEPWLTQLAADQPYLPDAENAENRVAFQRQSLASWCATVVGFGQPELDEEQDRVVSRDLPTPASATAWAMNSPRIAAQSV
jgi:hypothetical protein